MLQWLYKEGRKVNPFAKEVYERIRNLGFKRLLDVGSGDGRDSEFFASHGFEVTAVDLSEEGIQTLRERCSNIQAHCMDIRAIDFDDASFDVIYAHLAVQYFDDKETTS